MVLDGHDVKYIISLWTIVKKSQIVENYVKSPDNIQCHHGIAQAEEEEANIRE